MNMQLKARRNAKMAPVNAAMREPLLTKHEAARFFQVSSRCLDDWMARGLVPYLKIGRTVRFRLADVQSFLEKTCRMVGGKRDFRCQVTTGDSP